MTSFRMQEKKRTVTYLCGRQNYAEQRIKLRQQKYEEKTRDRKNKKKQEGRKSIENAPQEKHEK